MVLIVDDSITVRELLSLTFKRAGYRVEQARDGQEAWDKLRAGLPCDIVFCDIEMPRMDGLEFLSRIQKDPVLIKIPIAMLTSRGSDRHRQIASQLGASGYFIKPYLEEALLDAAKRMIVRGSIGNRLAQRWGERREGTSEGRSYQPSPRVLSLLRILCALSFCLFDRQFFLLSCGFQFGVAIPEMAQWRSLKCRY